MMRIPFFSKKEKSLEGANRGPFSLLGELGNAFGVGSLEDGWQRNLGGNDISARQVPAVYASVMASARAVSQCRPMHIITDKDGVKKKQLTGHLFKLLKRPNKYETWNQFILNMVAEMLFSGESFGYCVRDEKGKINQIHRIQSGSCSPYIADGEIFYSVGQNPMLAESIEALIPQRDIIHLRSYTPRHPLIGETPLAAASLALGVNVSLSKSQRAFFEQMSRPSGIISTDQVLTKDQMTVLRDAWATQSTKINQGGVPILGGGMKFQSMSVTSQDAEMLQAQKYSTADIARVFGVPLPIIGELENATLSNVESLISMWLSMSLGSLIENIEASFGHLFDLPDNQSINLDESALLRMDFKTRIEGLKNATTGGIYTINEARQALDLHPVELGDSPYLQQQMVPLGWTAEQAQREADEAIVEPVVTEPVVDEVLQEDIKSVKADVAAIQGAIVALAESTKAIQESIHKAQDEKPVMTDKEKTVIYLDTLRKNTNV